MGLHIVKENGGSAFAGPTVRNIINSQLKSGIFTVRGILCMLMKVANLIRQPGRNQQ